MIQNFEELRKKQPKAFADPFFLELRTLSEDDWAEKMDEIVTYNYGEESMVYRNMITNKTKK
jgi:hypothetical protein